ncbi:hypothetical protein Hypma_014431 [Hypsizygus marmoreus]|uniref:CxC1-like cysteine cluster associated with KDZ transposases domain-containing protein n=1 Tax=Hypsizygus marmoreus TaxID=39966 RepID=A0A369JCI6_HYPMA|nr:hypothetical protein Hypma_014431 [Hypsizygus marmoreus]
MSTSPCHVYCSIVISQLSSLSLSVLQVPTFGLTARQLLVRGFFPSAPLAPTLAVDLKVLEFVSSLFVNVAPNNTAWCKTVESFLSKQGYKLTTKDSLRKRFSNALLWYNALQDATTRHVNSILEHARRTQFDIDDGVDTLSSASTAVNPSTLDTDDGMSAHSSADDGLLISGEPSAPTTSRTPSRRATVEEVEDEDTPRPAAPQNSLILETTDSHQPTSTSKRTRTDEAEDFDGDPNTQRPNPFPSPPPRTRPSEYLRSRCPLCFGGQFPRPEVVDNSLGPDAIVCVDACFTQKRNKQARDPPRTHPHSVFVPEDDAIRMQAFVESVRPPKKPAPKRSRQQPSDDEDGYEGPLQVPTSALDGCESGFTAADDRREKASTQFFDDTALMALLCRHDVVLWIVNMRSAGEKQHYTLVLIETLFQHLPTDFTIGLLYDIGCQLHCSCINWGFLDRYLDRLTFAISVFHAFGHQWACQIIYHPWKCKGFGLSDGEGCERFWHSISKLIPYLRVCGYHQRLYTLDNQVQHAHSEALDKLGHWLLRRTRHCNTKLITANERLRACGHTELYLRTQWNLQVKAQTKPLPRRSKNQGKTAVEEAIQLRKVRDILKTRINELEAILIDPDTEADTFFDAELRLNDTKVRLADATARVNAKERALGVESRTELQRLFEMDRLERSFRKQVNDQKVNSHTESSVKRRDPSIQQVARDYNKFCDKMASLIQDRKAPRGAVCPPKIVMKGLFALDVDDDIWQDVGLHEGDEPGTMPPPWLCDEQVRDGIKAVLERDRCLEEQNRLHSEHRAMREWFSEEWKLVNTAFELAMDDSLRYQLHLRRQYLCHLCATWQSSVRSLDAGNDFLPQWGPSREEILEVSINEVTASIADRDYAGFDSDDDDDEGPDDGLDDDDADNVLIDTLDAVDLADAFCSGSLDIFNPDI